MRVAWVFDWFTYYSAGVLRALAPHVELLVVTREHGLELGLGADAVSAKREMFPETATVEFLRGRQSDPSSLVGALSARRQVRLFNPDVIHMQDHFDWRLLLASGGSAAPRVLTIHDVEPHLGWVDPRGGMQSAVERRVRQTADVICVHGAPLVDLARRQSWYRGQPVVCLPMGRHAQAAAMAPMPARPTVLFFGRLEHYKGLDLFVEAVECSSERVPGLRAIIAGEGEAADSARSLMTKPELFDWRVGFVPDSGIASLFAEASLVVLPYREASQSGVIPVAFANGRPVIATLVGALSDAVRDGVNGVLVEPENPALLADAISNVLGNAANLEALSQGAASSLESGDQAPSAVAGAHMRAYETAIRSGEAR